METVCRLLKQPRRALAAVNRVSLGCAKLLTISLLALLTLIVLLQIFCRYVLNNALSWPEEGARYLMVWMALLAAPIAYQRGEHVGITILATALSTRARAALFATIDLCVLVLACVLVGASVAVLGAGTMTSATSFAMPMIWVYLCFPTGMVMLVLVVLGSLLTHTADALAPSRTDRG